DKLGGLEGAIVATTIRRLSRAIGRFVTPAMGPPSDEEIRHAFRLLLGREPEEAGLSYFRTVPSLDALRQQIMASPEFVSRCLINDPNVSPFLTFFHPDAVRMTARRQEHLAGLGLPLAGRSVLEVGAGVGTHSTFFLDRDCSVLATDARTENVAVMKAVYEAYGWYARRGSLT